MHHTFALHLAHTLQGVHDELLIACSILSQTNLLYNGIFSKSINILLQS